MCGTLAGVTSSQADTEKLADAPSDTASVAAAAAAAAAASADEEDA